MTNYLRIGVSFVLVLLASFGLADWEGWGDVQQKFRKESTPDRKVAYLKNNEENILEYVSSSLSRDVYDYRENLSQSQKENLIAKIDAQLDSYVIAERMKKDSAADAQIKTIKQSEIFKRNKELKEATWLQKILERLKNLTRIEPPETPDFKMPEWLVVVLRVVFYLLLALALGILVWLVSKIRFGKRIKSVRARGLLEEGEELLSEDEYLLKAEELAAQGKFREACRCLYLAMLLHISTARIARFEPSETNWEHLRRIHGSPKRPAGLDLRPITKLFDLIWYGDGFAGAPQFGEFKSTYSEIKRLIAEAKNV